MSSNSDAKGASWTGKIYFDSDAGWPGNHCFISKEELLITMRDLVNPSDEILSVSRYKVPLDEWQWTNLLLNHQFIVFESECWYWSIEKNAEGITVQRCKSIHPVRDCYRQKARIKGGYWSVQHMETSAGTRTMDHLIKWLHVDRQLYATYGWLTSNCRHFAKEAMSFLTGFTQI